MAGDRKKQETVEVEPGAWDRFEKAVDGALHTKPKRQDEMKVGRQRKATSAKRAKDRRSPAA